ncbi:MAG: hypothetical protein AMJ95_13270 [Omnitrophica WOR_2 bacterium SM23_72]|nr:MAG: hypothetical protein AMJ95_13270 [Omnitrophica WOR_2 bacterium SM23_72]
MRPGTLIRWYALKDILKEATEDDSTVIDVGGYDGRISGWLKEIRRAARFMVVDIDVMGLRLATEEKLNAICASGLKLPFKNGRADVVLCLDLIEHVEEAEDLIKEISRVLKKDGRLILTTPAEKGVTFPFLTKEAIDKINKGFLGHAIRKGFFLQDLEKMLRSGSLLIVKKSRYFNFFSQFVYWLNAHSKVPSRGKDLFLRLTALLEPCIKWRAQVHIIVAKKSDGIPS